MSESIDSHAVPSTTTLEALGATAPDTPCLLLDEARMMRNIQRLESRARHLGVKLRPHLKTCKSLDIASRLLTEENAGATVSTLREAEVFADAGFHDLLYAVGISPQKLPRIQALLQRGVDMTVVLDSLEQAQAVVAFCQAEAVAIPVLLEIDSDDHRSGFQPGDKALLEVARLLHEGGAELRGVLTHAGESYKVYGHQAHTEFAELERDKAVACAQMLRDAGLPCPVVSVGSTPTAHGAEDLTGVTELRAGVYVFFDLVMAGIGVCTLDDLALSVLTTVIGHQHERNWILVDAGWMAMSQDRGTARQKVNQGYGMVCDINGKVIPDLIMIQANQEHGIISTRPGSDAQLPDLPVGSRVRILPNHACATAAQHEGYHVIPEEGGELTYWPRFCGW